MVVVLVAHDNRKRDLIAWARFNRATLAGWTRYATRTTGQTLLQEVGLHVRELLSGPFGGDARVGSMIAERAYHRYRAERWACRPVPTLR